MRALALLVTLGFASLPARQGDCHSNQRAARVILAPTPGLPTDPDDPQAFVDVFTDIDPLFVIDNESGWYEGWMIHDDDVAVGARVVPA